MRTPDSDDPHGDDTGGSLSGGSASLAEGFGGSDDGGDGAGSGDGGDAFGTGSSGEPGGEPSTGGGSIFDIFGLRGDDPSDPSGGDPAAGDPQGADPLGADLLGAGDPGGAEDWDLTGDGLVDQADFEVAATGGIHLDGDPAAPDDHEAGFFDA